MSITSAQVPPGKQVAPSPASTQVRSGRFSKPLEKISGVGNVPWPLTVRDRFAVALLLAASVTFATKLEVPAVVGVPEITPVELLRDKPAGSAPENDQV
jgi:hypothetical protein